MSKNSNSYGLIKHLPVSDKMIHTFFKSISQKVNVIARVEFEPAY